VANLEAVFDAFEIDDGAVLSFHHHYRNGDWVLAQVLDIARSRGLRGLTLAANSLFPVHAPIVPLIEDGTIAHVVTNYMRGPVADAIARGALRGTTLLQSHGGRARAIAARQLQIDAAFVAAPLARPDGAATGRGGALACGPLGYPAVDAKFARQTAVLAAEISPAPLPHIDIPAGNVDALVACPQIGTTEGIRSGATQASNSPGARTIAKLVASTVSAAGFLRDGLSLQSGSGGYSLGAVSQIGETMAEQGIVGSFLSGGITGVHARLLSEGRFARIRDVQCFDLDAVHSSLHHPEHHMMDAEQYASPLAAHPAIADLDVLLLGAVEVDAQFNVNVVRSAGGTILGGPGGHPDAAAGAKLRIITTDLTGGGYAKLVPDVTCVSTPGRDVDIVVTPHGIAVNPERPALAADLRRAGLPLRAFAELAAQAAADANPLAHPMERTEPVAYIEDRQGALLDWI